jgi:hypothetical protein
MSKNRSKYKWCRLFAGMSMFSGSSVLSNVGLICYNSPYLAYRFGLRQYLAFLTPLFIYYANPNDLEIHCVVLPPPYLLK